MEVILVEDVPSLGHIGDQVKVKGGYGRNYLLPNGLAIHASVKNKRKLEHDKKVASFKLAKSRANADAVAKGLQALTLTIARKVGEQDKLFGSVTTHDLEKALAAKGVNIDRRKLALREPIKALGEYEVPVKLHKDVTATIKVAVVAESAS